MGHKSLWRKLAWVILLLVFSSNAFSQSAYPNKPIKIVVPFGAGGVADLTARTVAQKLGENLGQSIVIENKPGAGGPTILKATDFRSVAFFIVESKFLLPKQKPVNATLCR